MPTIALDCGYGSIGPFNRAFKVRFGLTPAWITISMSMPIRTRRSSRKNGKYDVEAGKLIAKWLRVQVSAALRVGDD